MTYLFTWSCYATHFTPSKIPRLRDWRTAHSKYPPFSLNATARRLVCQAILEYSARKNVHLLALHVRQTHVHVVASSPHHPLQVCAGWKSAATRLLRKQGIASPQRPIWSDYRHIHRLPNTVAIASALNYVIRKQGPPLELYIAPHPLPQAPSPSPSPTPTPNNAPNIPPPPSARPSPTPNTGPNIPGRLRPG